MNENKNNKNTITLGDFIVDSGNQFTSVGSSTSINFGSSTSCPGGASGGSADAAGGYHVANTTAIPSHVHTMNVDFNNSYLSFGDDYSISFNDELLKFQQEKEEGEKLREEYPVLQEAWDHYLLIKKLLQDEEADKYHDDKYRGFKE